MSIVKPEMENEVIDPSVFADLEKFNEENDAIVYLVRSKSMVGTAVKWDIEVDKKKVASLKNKEHFVFHVDASVEGHSVQLPNLKFNYTNFKSNRYCYNYKRLWSNYRIFQCGSIKGYEKNKTYKTIKE